MLAFNTFINILQQGFCYALVALGVYISYKVLDFPDLTVDGTFPLGAAVSVVLINSGVHFTIAILIATLCGAAGGAITGFLHVKCKISKLLSGILTMTGLLSINLLISNSKVLVTYTQDTLFDNALTRLFPSDLRYISIILILAVIVVIMKIILDLFVKTKSGFMLRAVGDNEQMCISLGRSSQGYKVLGLVIANAFVGLAGSVYSQVMRYFDNASGTGMVVIALASVIIGCAMFKKVRFVKATTACIVGALIYTAALNIIIALGMPSIMLKMMMAILFALILVGNNLLSGKLRLNNRLLRRRK